MGCIFDGLVIICFSFKIALSTQINVIFGRITARSSYSTGIVITVSLVKLLLTLTFFVARCCFSLVTQCHWTSYFHPSMFLSFILDVTYFIDMKVATKEINSLKSERNFLTQLADNTPLASAMKFVKSNPSHLKYTRSQFEDNCRSEIWSVQ